MRIVFFVVALLALAFWGFAIFDMWAVLTAWPPCAEQYGADMFGWIQDFPLWRKAVWGASAGFGVIGSLMMLARVRGAGLSVNWLHELSLVLVWAACTRCAHRIHRVAPSA